jgi:hypothetical protein
MYKILLSCPLYTERTHKARATVAPPILTMLWSFTSLYSSALGSDHFQQFRPYILTVTLELQSKSVQRWRTRQASHTDIFRLVECVNEWLGLCLTCRSDIRLSGYRVDENI